MDSQPIQLFVVALRPRGGGAAGGGRRGAEEAGGGGGTHAGVPPANYPSDTATAATLKSRQLIPLSGGGGSGRGGGGFTFSLPSLMKDKQE